VKNKYSLGILIGSAFLGCGAPIVSFAYCQYSNAAAQQQCLAQEAQQRAQQQAQQRAQQEAQQRAQQEAQQRAQQEAQQRAQQQAQQQAQQRAQQEAQQRAEQQAQQRAQQEAQQRSQQQAQQRAQQQAQQQAQQRAQQQAQPRSQQQAQQHNQQQTQQQAQQRAQQEAQQRSQQQAQQHSQQQTQQQAQQRAQQEAQQRNQQQAQQRSQQQAQQRAQSHDQAQRAISQPSRGANVGPTAASNSHSSGAAIKAPVAAAPKPIQLNASTRAIVRPGSSVLTVKRTNPNGTQVVMNRQITHGKSVVTNAYISKAEASGDRSRTYLDGRKIVFARNGDIVRTSPNRVTVTTQKSGLRQAALSDGRPIYRERIEHAVHGSTAREVVIRTDYARVVVGRPVFYSAPVIRRYDVMEYYGYPVLAYEPMVFAPTFFGPFLIGFQQPVLVTPACIFCPAPVVAWQQPVQAYSDPVDLVADLQITSAVQDGMAEAPPPVALDSAPPQDDPQVADLRVQVSAIQQQVDEEAQSNSDLRNQVAELQKANAPAPPTAFNVPEPVRQQIHKQVRDNIRLHQEKRALTWPDIVASGEAPNYIFQVSDMLDATDTNGEECPLTTGDLLKLEEGAAPDKEVLAMHVVTSKSGSCVAGSVIRVSIHDAQAMLNDFNQRQEANMQKLQPQISLANKG
jgi:hypothetical protein